MLSRGFFVFSATLIWVAALKAQPQPVAKDGKLTIRMTLHPAPLPKPLSRYFLTPQYKEMQPGNRVPSYMKAYMEQANFFSKEPEQEREKWNGMLLEELPLDKIKTSGCVGGLAYRPDNLVSLVDGKVSFHGAGRPLADVDEGSRFLTSDWQMWSQIRRDGYTALLPEVQKLRGLASVLKVRMRYEIATKDFEKAAYSARTFFGMTQSFETHPTLIAGLVGIAIETICLNALEEMVQQPGCPNLYWSIAEIPAEAISLRTAIQGEKLICQTLFGGLLKARGNLTESELNQVFQQLSIISAVEGGAKARIDARMYYQELSRDEKRVAAARAMLVDSGMAAEVVRTLSAVQAVLTQDAKQFETDLDDYFTIYDLEFPTAIKKFQEFEAKLKANKDSIFSGILPAASKVLQAQVRTKQRIAYLRVIEAIRLHAYENGGKLPVSLKDLKSPLPLDPVSGEAFKYSLKDDVATLTGANPTPQTEITNRVYEIRIQK